MLLAYPRHMTEQQLKSVKHDLSYIALEASVLSNMVDTIKSVFPDMLANLKNSFFSTQNLPNIQIQMSSDHQFIVKEIKAFPFTEYGNLSVAVPEGFKGDYVSYLKELINATDSLKELSNKIIKPYYVYLSVFLSNKDAKKSTHNNDSFYKQINASRDKVSKDIGKFFNPTDPTAKLKVNKLIHNTGGVKDVSEFSTLLKSHIDKVDISEISKMSNQCLDLLAMIVDEINKGNITNVTPEITTNLSNGAYEVAKELEMFSVVYFRIMGAIGGVDNLAVRLRSFITNTD